PVSITAGTTYVASYHTNVGHYSVDPNYFGTHGVDSPPLHALANGVDGPNGVFIYTSSSVFPTDTFSSSNYWVDVVLTTGSGTGTAPTVSSVSPASGASGVSLNTNVTVRFSQAMNPATINTTTVQLIAPSSSGESSFIVPATVTYNSSTLTATLTPTQPLPGST